MKTGLFRGGWNTGNVWAFQGKRRAQAWERLSPEVPQGSRLGRTRPAWQAVQRPAVHSRSTGLEPRPRPRRGAGLTAPSMTFSSQPVCAVGVSTLPYSLASWALSD